MRRICKQGNHQENEFWYVGQINGTNYLFDEVSKEYFAEVRRPGRRGSKVTRDPVTSTELAAALSSMYSERYPERAQAAAQNVF